MLPGLLKERVGSICTHLPALDGSSHGSTRGFWRLWCEMDTGHPLPPREAWQVPGLGGQRPPQVRGHHWPFTGRGASRKTQPGGLASAARGLQLGRLLLLRAQDKGQVPTAPGNRWGEAPSLLFHPCLFLKKKKLFIWPHVVFAVAHGVEFPD